MALASCSSAPWYPPGSAGDDPIDPDDGRLDDVVAVQQRDVPIPALGFVSTGAAVCSSLVGAVRALDAGSRRPRATGGGSDQSNADQDVYLFPESAVIVASQSLTTRRHVRSKPPGRFVKHFN